MKFFFPASKAKNWWLRAEFVWVRRKRVLILLNCKKRKFNFSFFGYYLDDWIELVKWKMKAKPNDEWIGKVDDKSCRLRVDGEFIVFSACFYIFWIMSRFISKVQCGSFCEKASALFLSLLRFQSPILAQWSLCWPHERCDDRARNGWITCSFTTSAECSNSWHSIYHEKIQKRELATQWKFIIPHPPVFTWKCLERSLLLLRLDIDMTDLKLTLSVCSMWDVRLKTWTINFFFSALINVGEKEKICIIVRTEKSHTKLCRLSQLRVFISSRRI